MTATTNISADRLRDLVTALYRASGLTDGHATHGLHARGFQDAGIQCLQVWTESLYHYAS